MTLAARRVPAPVARDAPRWPGRIGAPLSLVGLGLAAYLSWAHFHPGPHALACPTHGIINCEAVTTSSYATVAHVPVAVAGLVFFAVMAILQLPALWRLTVPWLAGMRLAWAALGALSVVWLVYVELFRLGEICEYCTGVHIVTVALFAVTALGSAVAVEA